MRIRLSLFFLIAGFATIVMFGFKSQKTEIATRTPTNRPNIIYILADDMGYGDVVYLNPDAQVQTPNLDKLARDGMVFTDAHSGSAVCTPTRYGIITGRYAFRSRLKSGVLGGYSPALIEEDRFTVADLLKSADYSTGVIGKWHLGLDWVKQDPSKNIDPKVYDNWEVTENLNVVAGVTKGPNDIGFDFSYVIPASLDIAPYIYLRNGKPVDSDIVKKEGLSKERGVFYRAGQASKSFDIDNTLQNFGQQAQQFLVEKSKSEKPFFLYLPLSSPHTPWLPSEEFKGKSKAGIYGDFVMQTDDVVGKVIKTLDSLGLSENTLVIFTSDNGSAWKPGDKKLFPKHQANYIYKGEKSDIWEAGHHIPFIARWPRVVKKGGKSAQTICLTDLMATVGAITGQKIPANAGQDSFSFYSLLKNANDKQVVRESTIHHSIEGMFAIRKGKWKFVDGKGSGGWTSKGEESDPKGQLYDMEKDPSETKNLYNEYPEIVKELSSLLEKQKSQGYTAKK